MLKDKTEVFNGPEYCSIRKIWARLSDLYSGGNPKFISDILCILYYSNSTQKQSVILSPNVEAYFLSKNGTGGKKKTSR